MYFFEAILAAVGMYALVGVVFAALFVTAGVSKVDVAAKGGPIGFRVLIFPGSTALWPVMLVKWLRAGKAGND